MIIWLFVIAIGASVAVGLLVAGLQSLANRQRSSVMDSEPAQPEPVRHTEAERMALLAELAPLDVDTPPEVAADLALMRAAEYAASVLDGLERTVQQRLDRLWEHACEVLEQDELDAEWAALASGEFLAVHS